MIADNMLIRYEIHDYKGILRHKRFHSYACYHIYECLSIILRKIKII